MLRRTSGLRVRAAAISARDSQSVRRCRHEDAGRIMSDRQPGKCDAQYLPAVFRSGPLIDADQVGQLDGPAGFFECFAARGVGQRFERLQVAGRLVDDEFAANALLDDEKAPVARDDRRNRDIRPPDDLDVVVLIHQVFLQVVRFTTTHDIGFQSWHD